MPWYIFAFSSAILAAVASVLEKRVLRLEHAMEFSAVLAVFSLLLSLPLLATIDYSRLEIEPLVIVLMASFLGACAFLLVTKSIRHLEVSTVSPLLVLGPGITALMAFILLSEQLSRTQVIGLVLLMVGAYVIETHRHGSLWEPLRAWRSSKYLHFILLALLIYSLTAVLDRLVLSRYNLQPEAYIVFCHLFLVLHFTVMLSLFHNGWSDLWHGFRQAGWLILLVALFTVAYRYAQVQAIALIYVGLAEAVKRTSAFFATLIGGELFHEHNLRRKLAACVIMLVGAVLVVM